MLRAYMFGFTFSQLGGQLAIYVVPLIALQLLDASALEVALLTGVGFLPYVLLGLYAGVIADRVSPAHAMAACDLGRTLVSGVLLGLIATQALTIPLLFGVVVVNGVFGVVSDVCAQSLVPKLATSEKLPEANASLEIIRSTVQVTGPALAGGLVGLLGALPAVIANGLLYLISAALLVVVLLIGGPASQSDVPKPATVTGVHSAIGQGLKFVTEHKTLRTLVLAYFATVLGIGVFQSVSIVYLVDVARLTPEVIGVVYAIGNIGFVVGAAWARLVVKKVDLRKLLLVGSLASPLCAALFALAGALHPAVVVVALFVGALGTPVYNTAIVTLRQQATPADMLGRVASISRVVGRGSVPFGSAVGGGVAQLLGVPIAVGVASLIGWVGAGVALKAARG